MYNSKNSETCHFLVWLLCMFLLSAMIGCENQSKQHTPKQVDEKHKKYTELELTASAEKIELVSIMMNTSYDTVYQVLSDYKLKTEYYEGSEDCVHINAGLAIGEISSKYHISRKRLARFLFANKYQMITREEIEEETLENADQDVDPDDGPGY